MTAPELTLAAVRRQLQSLRAAHASGALAEAPYREARAPLERKLADLVVDAADGAWAAAGEAAAAPPRVRLSTWAALGALAVVVAGAGYAWMGSPGQVGLTPPGFAADAAGASAAPASAPHALGQEQIAAMGQRLAERLKTQPDDAEGWSMLGRTYMALGRTADALAAYERLVKLRPDDATGLADYADALAVQNGRKLEGPPMALLARALKADPDNLKALSLVGTAAFDRGDYAAAAKHWDRAVRTGPPDSPMVQQARSGADEARARGKLPGAAPDALPGMAAANPESKADSKAATVPVPPAPGAAQVADLGIAGVVTLAPELLAQASPSDTVFIFARPVSGSRMPVAILRKQVKDLPATFRLDDSLAMSPAARLSTAGPVVVGARISKSSQAAPQPGDLEGLSEPTAAGKTGVAVKISRRVP